MSRTYRHGGTDSQRDYERNDYTNPWLSVSRQGAQKRREAKRYAARQIRRLEIPTPKTRQGKLHSIHDIAYYY